MIVRRADYQPDAFQVTFGENVLLPGEENLSDGHWQTIATGWAQIGGWSFSDGMSFEARSGISATLSVTVSGAPAEFRIVMEVPEKDWAQRVMKPGSVHFDPQGGTGSFSYTFVAGVGPGAYTINLLWRSPTGIQTNLDDGSLVVQYAAR